MKQRPGVGATRGSNILDLVFSNEVSMVEDLKVLEHFSTSDHNVLEFQCVLSTGQFYKILSIRTHV